jgi:CBS-domain-containing membrane protein
MAAGPPGLPGDREEAGLVTSTVKDVMTSNVVAVRKEAEFKEIIKVMRRRHFSAFPVLDGDDRVAGVVSEADLLLKEAFPAAGGGADRPYRWRDRAKAAALTAADLMTSPAVTIGPDCPVTEAARLMLKRRVKRLPVVADTGRLLGIVSRVDVLGLYDRADADIRGEIVDDVITDLFLLEPGSIMVKVVSGIVTLSGPIENAAVANSLIGSVWHLDGVVDVRDRLHY